MKTHEYILAYSKNNVDNMAESVSVAYFKSGMYLLSAVAHR